MSSNLIFNSLITFPVSLLIKILFLLFGISLISKFFNFSPVSLFFKIFFPLTESSVKNNSSSSLERVSLIKISFLFSGSNFLLIPFISSLVSLFIIIGFPSLFILISKLFNFSPVSLFIKYSFPVNLSFSLIISNFLNGFSSLINISSFVSLSIFLFIPFISFPVSLLIIILFLVFGFVCISKLFNFSPVNLFTKISFPKILSLIAII